jgi:hypothetical protein
MNTESPGNIKMVNEVWIQNLQNHYKKEKIKARYKLQIISRNKNGERITNSEAIESIKTLNDIQ